MTRTRPALIPVEPASVVLWDADGVLQRMAKGEESIRSSVEGLVEDVDGFVAEAVEVERPALRGEVRWLDVLPGLLARWGIADAYDDLVRAWLATVPVPGARDLVRALREAGVRCYLATNQDAHRGAYMQQRLGYRELLDGAFYSYELGVAKPEPAYFRTVLARLETAPGDALLIDDNATNVESARALGLRAELWSSREPVEVLRGHLTRHGLLS
ncbi:MAG: putative hydrolase of the superfamily [Nocardioidaceae bacterium]|nr:putative hydrolase of the superfamily [Nocardioidaceae bacterium]